jgi:hypothetical protein
MMDVKPFGLPETLTKLLLAGTVPKYNQED